MQAFCAAKPWRRANSLRPSILISRRNPKKEVTTYVVTSFFGAGDEARSRHCRAATRTAGTKRPTGAFSRFARALFDPRPAERQSSALLRRTSVLRSKTLAQGEFTSPEHFNFSQESKKRGMTIVMPLFLERATRLELAYRHPTNRLAAICGNPASPLIQCAFGAGGGSEFFSANEKTGHPNRMSCFDMERATRLELATSTLARWRSTR